MDSYRIRKPDLLSYIIQEGEAALTRLDWINEKEPQAKAAASIKSAIAAAKQGIDHIPQELYANGELVQIWEPEVPKAIWMENSTNLTLQECTGAPRSIFHYNNLIQTFSNFHHILCSNNHFSPFIPHLHSKMPLNPETLAHLMELLANQLGAKRLIPQNV